VEDQRREGRLLPPLWRTHALVGEFMDEREKKSREKSPKKKEWGLKFF
jgi:hypothetical protein